MKKVSQRKIIRVGFLHVRGILMGGFLVVLGVLGWMRFGVGPSAVRVEAIGDGGGITINPAYSESQDVKVLVIEMNPHLNTVEGRPKASDYLLKVNESARVAVEEEVADLEWASGGYLDIKTTWEYVDEFPRYKTSITLPDGSTGNAFNEENYLLASDDGSGNHTWWNLYHNGWLEADKVPEFSFDYGWLIDKLDLVNRKNNGEFDQVWLAATDPTQVYETMMVGRTAYWINGQPYEADCDNFMIAYVNMARRDSGLHALGHGVENLIKSVYGTSYDPYKKDSVSISTAEEYLALNDWERFTLNDYANSGTLNGVGTVHYPFTASGAYDYTNTTNVSSTYLEWNNKSLGEMTGEYTLANHLAWDSAPYKDSGPNLSGGRHFMRFWLSLFPREVGYTKEGYLKNWWKYIYSMDHVVEVSGRTEYSGVVGEDLEFEIALKFASGKEESGRIEVADESFEIANPDVVGIVDGKLRALSKGESAVTVYRDGKSIEYRVVVEDAPEEKDDDDDDNDEAGGRIAVPDTGENTQDDGGLWMVICVAPVVVLAIVWGRHIWQSRGKHRKFEY